MDGNGNIGCCMLHGGNRDDGMERCQSDPLSKADLSWPQGTPSVQIFVYFNIYQIFDPIPVLRTHPGVEF